MASWPCKHCGALIEQHGGPFKSLCNDCRPLKMRDRRSRYFTLAHAYVETAIREGDLPKLDGSIACKDCGEPAHEYDHRDYKQPLKVEPVCRACNNARGPGLHANRRADRPLTIRQRFERAA